LKVKATQDAQAESSQQSPVATSISSDAA